MLVVMNQVVKKNKHILFQLRINCGELLEFLHSVICKIQNRLKFVIKE